MPLHDDRPLLARAQALVEASVPGIRAARVPTGLFLALPRRWTEDDLVALTVTADGGRLSLRASGPIVRALIDAGATFPGSPWYSALADGALALDAGAGTLSASVPALADLPGAAMAAGELLARLRGEIGAGTGCRLAA